MEFRQLQYFLAAAQTQNFRKAADLCLVAQSALSRQIAALEAELGVLLFRRSEQRVFLTLAGQEFAAFARNALDELQKGQQAMVELAQGERGTVTVGCVEALATNFLPQVFARFNQEHPNVRLRVRTGGADDLMRLVEQGVLDFGLIFDPVTHSELLTVREIFRQPLQVVVAKNHPLARYKGQSLLLADIIDQPIVALSEGFSMHRILHNLFTRYKLNPSNLVEIDLVDGMREFVKQGVGICFAPAALIKPHQIEHDFVLLPLVDLTDEYSFALVYRRIGSISLAARGLIEAISKAI